MKSESGADVNGEREQSGGKRVGEEEEDGKEGAHDAACWRIPAPWA